MNGAGRIPNVSRRENSELFSLVIGGYGLIGVGLSADIQPAKDDVLQEKAARRLTIVPIPRTSK